MALSELSLISKVIEAMLTHYEPPLMYERFRKDQWTEVENELTAGIRDPKPDVVESYLWSMYPKGTRDDFDDLAPTQYGYAMPTFAMESKGASDPERALKQAAYDGALMTHAAIAAEAQMGKDETTLYSKTKAITITLNPEEICVYANHAVKDRPSGRITYHHHCVERVRYLASETTWNTAHMILRDAQRFALTLADRRIRDIEVYFQEKAERMVKMKAENDKLQSEARTKVHRFEHESPPKRATQMQSTEQARGTTGDQTVSIPSNINPKPKKKNV